MKAKVSTSVECNHCHQHCSNPLPSDFGDEIFCCYGCKVVFELINDLNALLSLEKLNHQPYAYLDHPSIKKKLLDFQNENIEKINIELPQIHCSSCIFLLENLGDLHPGVLQLKVNFTRKRAEILYDVQQIPLSFLAALLKHIGYPPYFEKAGKEDSSRKNKSQKSALLYQLGIAGFFFGNTMLLALPEYLEAAIIYDRSLLHFFRYLMFAFSFPVILYSARDYFINTSASLKAGVLSIDLPIVIGIIALFGQSTYEIISGTGAGYFDSLTGLIFFLLLGKWYQQKTYKNFAFDKDYRSFLPIAATLLQGDQESTIPIEEIKKGDEILIRSGELIPCDGQILSKTAQLDYSFITGESEGVLKQKNDEIYAGGKLISQIIRIRAETASDQSYLSSLWTNKIFHQKEKKIVSITDKISQYFTPIILLLALTGAIVWSFIDSTRAIPVFTSVLIVACPCALALAEPFTTGSFMRWYGRFGLYLSESSILSKLAKVNALIFDKTGTLTEQNNIQINWTGIELLAEDLAAIYGATQMAQHPFARGLQKYLAGEKHMPAEVLSFEETLGEGISFIVHGNEYRIGKSGYIISQNEEINTTVYVQKNGEILGSFSFKQKHREQLSPIIKNLKKQYHLSLLSGDSEKEKDRFREIFGIQSNLMFEQSPKEKLEYIDRLQNESKHCLMVGDGLNDAGALKQSDVGISLFEENVNYFPACDALLKASSFQKLPQFLELSRMSKTIIRRAFALSFSYNIIGLSLALSGVLSPLFSAILMPLSSISVILYCTISAQKASLKLLGKPS